MSKKIAVIGAGGHARAVISLLKNLDFEIEGIYDENFRAEPREFIQSALVKGKLANVPSNLPIVLAVGSNSFRKELFENSKFQIVKENCIHPTVFIEESCKMGTSNNVFGRVFVNGDAEIGNNNILNTGAIIEHEAKIGNHNHISIGAIIAGRVEIGNECFIGAGAVIKDQIKIGNKITIGAGAVVVKDILEPGVYVGTPAKKLK